MPDEKLSSYWQNLIDDLKVKGNTMASTRVKSENDKLKAAILKGLEQLGGETINGDDLKFEGTEFIFPASMEGNLAAVRKFIEQQERLAEERFEFQRQFNYRPMDGAHAFESAMRKMWGTAGAGKPIAHMFGVDPPQYITVNTSATETAPVPWGRVGFSPLAIDFYLTEGRNEYGQVFRLVAEGPRKYRKHVEGFFTLVENELRNNSIYRGKAFTGTAGNPTFINTDEIDPSRVVYSEDVLVQLTTNMWSLLRHTEAMRENGMPLKRAVLIEGPYGTGKTLAGRLTAKEAVENGWTYIQARPGKDDLTDVLHTAQLYAPAVVWYEDIDNVASGSNSAPITALLDALDGVTNKGVEILAGFTTNFVERIHKGVLRPGRLDAVIHIDELDARGYELLVKVTVPEGILGTIDYAAVAEAFQGYVPAYATEAINRALRYSMSRNGGIPTTIETQDLVNAANGLRPQLALQEAAKEGVAKPGLEAALEDSLANVLDRSYFTDNHGQPIYKLKAIAASNGK